MNNVDLGSPALKLAEELNTLYENEVWILDFEQNLDKRKTLDQINRQIDSNQYPTLETAMEIHVQWKSEIDKMDKDQKKLSDLSLKITPSLEQLKSWILSPQEVKKIYSLQPVVAAQIDQINTRLAAEVGKLELHLKRIDSVWKKALEELNHIRRHPLARLEQTIQHIKNGEKTSSVVSYTKDKLIRHASSLYEQLLGSSEKKDRSESESKG